MLMIIIEALFFFTSFAAADNFIFPPDASDPTADDPSRNPVLVLGTSQIFTWTASVPSVNLTLFQNGEDYNVICTNCVGGQYIWDGQITQDLSNGPVFYLTFIADDATKGATSRFFNITSGPLPGSQPTDTNSPGSTSSMTSAPPSSTSAPPQSSSQKTTSSAPDPSAISSTATSLTSKPVSNIPAPSSLTQPLVKTPTSPAILSPTSSFSTSTTSTSIAATSPSTSPKPQASPTFTPLKLSLTIALPLLALALALLTTILFLLRRRKRLAPVRAQSPPPWSGPPATAIPIPESKAGYERVEMEVPGSVGVNGIGGGSGSGGAEGKEGGNGKAESGGSGRGENGVEVEEPRGVELP